MSIQVQPEEKLTISFLNELQIDSVLQIAQMSLGSSPSRSSFEDALNNGDKKCSLVATYDTEPVGFVLASFILDEVHIDSIAVSKEYRGEGIGTELLRFLIEIMKQQKSNVAFLEVRESNVVAQHMYFAFGFSIIGTRKKYYPNGEDALMLKANVSELQH